MAHKSQNPNVLSGKSRVMILCFDGTWNKFSQNSNVVHFFKALQKGDSKRQIVYYQPGIGTVSYNKRSYNKNSYTKRTFTITHMPNTVASALDAAIASSLDDHVKNGYQFIVDNYRIRPGDKICVFGFSRGAHTARVVAGMVYKVGIMPKDSPQLADFAFSIYSATGYNGYKQSQGFKRTFTHASAPGHQVSVDFVGVWDTVCSVGINPEVHPYTSVNYAVKKFRHALALDECRARFQPELWSETAGEGSHELDVDLPVPDIPHKLNRDDFIYNPTDRDFTDVKEVWFPGNHADVGGGSDIAIPLSSPTFIPLQWMIKECILSETGIRFDLKYLKDDIGFDFDGLLQEIGNETENIVQYDDMKKFCGAQLKKREGDHETEDTTDGTNHTKDNPKPRHLIQRLGRQVRDILDDILYRLLCARYLWWILEVIPVLYSYQDYHGNWIRRRMPNFGRGRWIPIYKNKVLVHSSVKKLIDEGYTPSAYNWSYLQQDVIEYVN